MYWLSIVCAIGALATQGKAQDGFSYQLADSALNLTTYDVTYDPGYYVIGFPGGDVPRNRGVCTDVVIRAYRYLGIDLQELVHHDMRGHFDQYPRNWGLTKPDPNIDHRRVPNLMCFFGRHGKTLAISSSANEYLPGHIVCWNLGGGVMHIGLVSSVRSTDGKRYCIIHNIGAGQVLEDCLFSYQIIGHYQYGSN
ncbi:MAG: DUF1287 domain-containing protein [Bacteroidetes bacterium]|jgi:uncharacterized protein YijF (DUF1287 family)|nr:DUF1287 domain-containing protein [Bacteroidota bacterium]